MNIRFIPNRRVRSQQRHAHALHLNKCSTSVYHGDKNAWCIWRPPATKENRVIYTGKKEFHHNFTTKSNVNSFETPRSIRLFWYSNFSLLVVFIWLFHSVCGAQPPTEEYNILRADIQKCHQKTEQQKYVSINRHRRTAPLSMWHYDNFIDVICIDITWFAAGISLHHTNTNKTHKKIICTHIDYACMY